MQLRKQLSIFFIFMFLLGCAKPKPGQPPLVDQVIQGLQLADQVDQQLVPIMATVNPEVAAILTKIDADLQLVVKVYTEYDTKAGENPTNAALLRATVSSIQTNLAAILDAIGVKNPKLITTVRVGVLIVNTALVAVLDRLPPPTTTVTQAQPVTSLGILPNQSVDQLKQTWNQQVKAEYPQAVLR